MDGKLRVFRSISQTQLPTFAQSYGIPNFARSWLKLDEPEVHLKQKTLYSFKETISFEGKGEFCGLVEVTARDGYFIVTNSIGPAHDRIETVQDGLKETITCKRFLKFHIKGDLYAEGSFHGQFHEDKENIVSLRFMAKDFLATVAKYPNWILCLLVRIELSITPNSQWKSLGMASSAEGMEPPFFASLRSRAFADVTIDCKGRTFQAHKSVLSCVSTVFARMLGAPVMESSGTHRIKIDGQSSSIMEHMLDFIYTGKFRGLPEDALVDQLYCAEMYDLEDLKAAVLFHMLLAVSNLNVIKFLKAAKKCNANRDVLNKLYQHCRRNFSSLSTRAEFKEFFKAHFHDFFTTVNMSAC